jgi:hypothetical protein
MSAKKAQEIGLGYMLGSAAGVRLLAALARDGEIGCAELAGTVELMRRRGVQPLATFVPWLVARYSACFDVPRRCLVHAERILIAVDSQLRPESVVRDETMSVLGITDLALLLETTPRSTTRPHSRRRWSGSTSGPPRSVRPAGVRLRSRRRADRARRARLLRRGGTF